MYNLLKKLLCKMLGHLYEPWDSNLHIGLICSRCGKIKVKRKDNGKRKK